MNAELIRLIGRELYHLYEHVLSNKTRLILDEMCRLYGKFASYLKGTSTLTTE